MGYCQPAAAAAAACAASLASCPDHRCPTSWTLQQPSPASRPVGGSGSTSSSKLGHEPRPSRPEKQRTWRHPATANHQYLTLVRSLVHAWGADPQSGLANAVWAGCGPLVLELLRTGADPRDMRHEHECFGHAAALGRWGIVEGMYGRVTSVRRCSWWR